MSKKYANKVVALTLGHPVFSHQHRIDPSTELQVPPEAPFRGQQRGLVRREVKQSTRICHEQRSEQGEFKFYRVYVQVGKNLELRTYFAIPVHD